MVKGNPNQNLNIVSKSQNDSKTYKKKKKTLRKNSEVEIAPYF